uniref:Uncharacterized protein n=1 Tax=Acrobeloides nanus TaxID=290746 RepID=A0A914CCK3_9BILA
MLELAERLKQAKSKLSKVKTTVTLEDGTEVIEVKDKDGRFITQAAETSTEVEIPNGDSNILSNRLKKAIERKKKMGFVIDFKPDLQAAEVMPGVFLSSQDVAQDFQLLSQHKITHILNCATGIKNLYEKNFTYLKIEMLDAPWENIRKHVILAIKFIDEAVSTGGRVLVHCNAGISRSTTLVLVYFMFKEKKSLNSALAHIRNVRNVARPNMGFMMQLNDLEKALLKAKTLEDLANSPAINKTWTWAHP